MIRSLFDLPPMPQSTPQPARGSPVEPRGVQGRVSVPSQGPGGRVRRRAAEEARPTCATWLPWLRPKT